MFIFRAMHDTFNRYVDKITPKQPETLNLETLPTELITLIVDKLNLPAQNALMQTSRKFRNLIESTPERKDLLQIFSVIANVEKESDAEASSWGVFQHKDAKGEISLNLLKEEESTDVTDCLAWLTFTKQTRHHEIGSGNSALKWQIAKITPSFVFPNPTQRLKNYFATLKKVNAFLTDFKQ